MQEMRIYLLNNTKPYREGEEEYSGAWFNCPVDFEEVREKIGVEHEEQIEIADYELPFDLHSDMPLWEINANCRMVLELEGTPIGNAMKNGTLETSTGFRFPTDWVGKNVKMILENQVYLGHMVSHKTQTKSFKNRKLVAVPKEDWIVVKNTHEAIIDEETFELVQKFISVKKRPNKTGRPNMFVGLVKFPDCGRNMAFSNLNGREPRFRCRTYARNSNLCTTHAISYDALVKIVMDDIQKHIKNMETLGDQFIEEMRVLSESGGGKKIKQFKQELELAEKRIAEIDSIIMKLFEQNVAGKISDGRFEKMSVTYENEQRELEERRKALKEKIEAEDYKTKNTNQFLETIRKYENVTELNRSMLVELIDSIYVYQAEGTGKERTQKVEINYRFLCESQCGIA